MGDDNTNVIAGSLSDYAPGTIVTDPNTGIVYSADENGNLISSGITDASAPTMNIPDQGSMGQGPGGGPVDTGFNLGAVATGIMNTANAIAAATPQTVNAIRNAKTAIAAARTPTATQQWLQMPLQQQILWVVGIGLVVILALRRKL